MKVHGKNTRLKVNGVSIKGVNTSSPGRTRDVHDSTEYGDDRHKKDAGLKDGTFTFGGTYDNSVGTGPRGVLLPLYESGEECTILRYPEGEGVGKPLETITGFVSNYVEPAPVADMITWTCEIAVNDIVDSVQ